jgi:ribulose-5-phosphate 4-epimerase/fuculose-1-phosphate aldolase
VPRIAGWRWILRRVGLIGQDPNRYGGAAFGNLSVRVASGFSPPGRRPFIITGTQTSGKREIGVTDFALVRHFDHRSNSVSSRGPVEPSSEAMTHGAIYDLDATIEAVFHAHSPEIWRLARELNLPTTDPAAAYGTPEMAAEVRRQFRLGDLRRRSLLVMGGHIDGVMVFGNTPEEAGTVLLAWLARAYSMAG